VHTRAEGDGTEASSEVFRLVTDLLDIKEYPALDLACCYPQRWGCETVIGHHKTDMGEGQPVLRSKDPEGVAQEMRALYAVYQAICAIAGGWGQRHGHPAGPISFPHALAATAVTVAAFPPDQAHLALAAFLLKILMPGFFVRGRPRPCQFPQDQEGRRLPGTQPGEPSVTKVTRRIELHLLHPRQVT
jgi:hypothetical protein